MGESEGASVGSLSAFDCYVIDITPDYIIRVHKDVLDGEDGPMLH
jgi:hypothetical protein